MNDRFAISAGILLDVSPLLYGMKKGSPVLRRLPFCIVFFVDYSPRISATATSLTLVPVGPVMISPPVFCRAW